MVCGCIWAGGVEDFLKMDGFMKKEKYWQNLMHHAALPGNYKTVAAASFLSLTTHCKWSKSK